MQANLYIVKPLSARKRKGHTFMSTDEIVKRASMRLLYRWSKDYDAATDKEAYLLKQLNKLADYLEATCSDPYLHDLYYILLNAYTEKRSLQTALTDMERVRKLYVAEIKARQRQGAPPLDVTQYVHEPDRKLKLKFLMRLTAAQHVANLLYKKLKVERQRAGKAPLPEKNLAGTIPDETIHEIKKIPS